MNATINQEKKHFPVLLNELVRIISPLYGGTFIDCTFGQGEYTKKILENKTNKVIALDRDSKVEIFAREIESKFKGRFQFYNQKFSNINKLNFKNENIKAIIFDLGFSMNQISNLDTGLSFKSKGKLDMRLGLNDISSHEVVMKMDEENLKLIFKYFGEEKKAKLIARKIIKERQNKILNTENLVNIVDEINKYNFSKKNHATKIFQALRIFVNKEISELINGLINSFSLLPIGGIIAVVTFHSIEDKIVKFFFNNYSKIKNSSRYIPNDSNKIKCLKVFKTKPIKPTIEEIKKNPASRSAKLRYAQKISEENNFLEFKKKFEYLVKVESLEV
mgnify:CR=1 FL=1